MTVPSKPPVPPVPSTPVVPPPQTHVSEQQQPQPQPQPGGSGGEPAAAAYAGIDVAKDKLDLADSTSQAVDTIAYDQAGLDRIVGRMLKLKPALIVVESTGGLERRLVAALLDAALPVALVNPRHVRHFAAGMRLLAKTDAIDARVLVSYARHAQPRLTERRSANAAELDALVVRRRQLRDACTEEANRLLVTDSKFARQSIQAVVRMFEKQVERIASSRSQS
jgi:transposase